MIAADHSRASTVRPILLDILNFYERMAIAVRQGTLDSDILYDDKGAQAVSFFRWVWPFIEQVQRDHEPRAFVNFVALALQWEGNLQKERQRRRRKTSATVEGDAIKKRSIF
jgi:hypothetical protein